MPSSRQLVSSGSPLEPEIGLSRAVRSGSYVCVAGTAPIAEGGGVAAPGDVYAQSVRCLDIAEQALKEAGASLADVVRTRVMDPTTGRMKEIKKVMPEADLGTAFKWLQDERARVQAGVGLAQPPQHRFGDMLFDHAGAVPHPAGDGDVAQPVEAVQPEGLAAARRQVFDHGERLFQRSAEKHP